MPHGQPHAVFGGVISISGRWMLICKDFIMAEDSCHVTMQCITFSCSLGVHADGVIASTFSDTAPPYLCELLHLPPPLHYRYIHVCMHACTHTACTHIAHMHTHRHMHRVSTLTRLSIRRWLFRDTHKHMHVHTHKHTHVHTLTHTHTHTLSLCLWSGVLTAAMWKPSVSPKSLMKLCTCTFPAKGTLIYHAGIQLALQCTLGLGESICL